MAGGKLDASHGKRLGRGTIGHAAAAQQGAAAARELHEGERFGEVVIRAAIERHDLVEFGIFGGEHHDGNRRGGLVGAQAPHDLEAIGVGQHDVEQNRIGDATRNGSLELAVRCEPLSLYPLLAQRIEGEPPNIVIVLDVVNHRNGSSRLLVDFTQIGR